MRLVGVVKFSLSKGRVEMPYGIVMSCKLIKNIIQTEFEGGYPA